MPAAGAPGPVGILVNPHAGKDVRRLTSHASPVSDAAKTGIVRRVLIGVLEGGRAAERHGGCLGSGVALAVVVPDAKGIVSAALRELDVDDRARVEVLDGAPTGRRDDTVHGAEQLRKHGATALVALGGDGTQRDVACGWRDAPLVALSTGTNNVFPRQHEATTAGCAAALVAAGVVRLEEVSSQAKVLRVEISGDGCADAEPDLALVEVALLAGAHTGARAVSDPSTLRAVVAAIADPAAVGLSAVAAAVRPLTRHEPGAVSVELDRVGTRGVDVHRVPLAPGRFADVAIRRWRVLDGERGMVCWRGPGVLAFDGERDRVLGDAAHVRVTWRADGPRVIDPDRVLRAAVRDGVFVRRPLAGAV